MATSIEVTNLREGEALAHPLVLLEGFVRGLAALPLVREELYVDVRLDAARGCFWPVTAHAGRFKALVLLPAPGKYAITLRLSGQQQQQGHSGSGAAAFVLPERLFVVEYRPAVTRYVVRFYYQKSADAGAAEGFDAPPGTDNSDQAAIDKIRFNALLMQLMTAEMFHDQGLPRRTFAMEFAADGLPLVRMLRSTFTNATARSIHDQELIRLVHADIDAFGLDAHDELEFKHAVILGCSRYNRATQKAEGHTALGGERVGVFGSCGLHTWPRHLGELTASCLNNAKVDTALLMDDSCYRGTFWSNYATGIGAFLHELGHTFGLGHSDAGVMGRGFDDMNRLLCAYEIDPHCGAPGFYHQAVDGRLQLNLAAVREIASRNGAHWNAGSARILQHCPWISGGRRKSQRVPSVSWVHDVCGPVGQGQYDGQQIAFNTMLVSQQYQPSAVYDLGAVLVDVGSFLNRLQTFSRAEVAHWDDSQRRSSAGKHLVMLLEGEFVTQVDVRAMAYIDGIQIHTNRRSSRWFGGFGGVLEILKPADGCQIHGFFGTVGDNYVGTLGALCSQVLPSVHHHHPHHHGQPVYPLAAPTAATGVLPSQTVAGLALSDGEQLQFNAQCASTSSLRSIAVKCGDFVSSVRVLSSEEHAKCVAEQDKKTFRKHEHVFELVAGEKVVRVEARSGHWVDAVRFVTSLRTSPWFGGAGGSDFIAIDAPSGYQICGFFGTRGANYVGSIGALFCPEVQQASSVQVYQHQNRDIAGAEDSVPASFSLMNTLLPSAAPVASAHAGQPVGILVVTQGHQVTFVQSFDSFQGYDKILNRLYGMSQFNGMEVACFPLTLEEKLLQVDVSYHAIGHASSPSSAAIVNGVCFHTTTRCSSWIGAFEGDNLRFFMAPVGRAIHDVTSVFTNSTLTDIAGHHVSASASSRAQYQQQPPAYFHPDGRARLDSGGFDVRAATNSSFGIESVHLLKKNGGDHLNIHAWDWVSPRQLRLISSGGVHATKLEYPQRWFIPQKMLTDKIKTSSDGHESPGELLFKEYVVGALDCGGGFSKAAGPPQ